MWTLTCAVRTANLLMLACSSTISTEEINTICDKLYLLVCPTGHAKIFTLMVGLLLMNVYFYGNFKNFVLPFVFQTLHSTLDNQSVNEFNISLTPVSISTYLVANLQDSEIYNYICVCVHKSFPFQMKAFATS